MSKVENALKQPDFRWLPKHLNHIAEKIVFQKRNISFLSINALFRQKEVQIGKAPEPFSESYIISALIPVQKNDKLRTKAEDLFVVFRLDKH